MNILTIYTRFYYLPQKNLRAILGRGIERNKLLKVADKLKLATYNVNSIRSRLHIVLPWLQANSPDYFCMQETKVADAVFPAAEFEALGYNVNFRGDKQYKGVAIVSKQKPQKVIYGFDSEPADADRMIIASYNNLTIINTYVPQGQEMESPQFAYKREWLARFKKYLQKHFQPQNEIIWCGDLNIAPEQIDVHDPKRLLGHVCFNPEVWKALEEIKSWGLTDVFRRHHPGEAGQYTFFDYRIKDSVQRKLGWRVDHIMATEKLAAKSKGCLIDLESRLKEKPSDHLILYAQW